MDPAAGRRAGPTDDDVSPRTLAERNRYLLRVRALLAVAESSEFAAEAEAFTAKARSLANDLGIDPDLLRFPREPLETAVLVAELRRLRQELEEYRRSTEEWATKTAEWSTCLDDYDMLLETAAEWLRVPVPRLPPGCRRHFRPEQRAAIEHLVNRKASSR